MKRLRENPSLIAATLGMVGVLAVLCAELLKRRAASVLLQAPLEHINQINPIGGGNDSLTVALAVLALLSGALAIAISGSRISKGDTGQFTSIGVVSGFLAIAWVGKLYFLGP